MAVGRIRRRTLLIAAAVAGALFVVFLIVLPIIVRRVAVDQLSKMTGRAVARDEAVSPASTWKIDQLTVDGAGISTRAGGRPGRLSVKGSVNGTALALQADTVEVSRTAVEARMTFGAFDVTQAVPYVPAT